MMQRLMHVTSGYLTFTFTCMLAGAAIFLLTGLALTQPRVFFVVLALVLAAFFVVRMEVKAHRHSLELNSISMSDPNRLDKSIVEMLAFTEATSVLLSTLTAEPTLEVSAFWVTEWTLTRDPVLPIDKGEDIMSPALDALRRHYGEIAKYGLRPYLITAKSAEDVIQSMRSKMPSAKFLSIAPTENKIITPPKHRISIVFIQETPSIFSPKQIPLVQKILQASFRLVKTQVITSPLGSR